MVQRIRALGAWPSGLGFGGEVVFLWFGLGGLGTRSGLFGFFPFFCKGRGVGSLL